MLTVYWCSFVVMLFVSLLLFKKKRTISALCGVVLFSYSSFFILYYLSLNGTANTIADSIRVGSISVLVMICGMKSETPIVYFIYALILLVNLVVNVFWLFIVGFEQIADIIYLTIAIMELIIFCVGADMTRKLNSWNRNVTFNIGNIGSINNYWCGLISGDDTISKGAGK